MRRLASRLRSSGFRAELLLALGLGGGIIPNLDTATRRAVDTVTALFCRFGGDGQAARRDAVQRLKSDGQRVQLITDAAERDEDGRLKRDLDTLHVAPLAIAYARFTDWH